MDEVKVNLKDIEGFISSIINRLRQELELEQLAELTSDNKKFVALIEQWYDIKIEVVSDDIGNIDWFLPQRDFELLVLKHL